MTITLPLPDKRLSPNGRIHWRERSKKVRIARLMAAYLATGDLNQLPSVPTFTGYSLAFFYPDARKRDDDNTEGSFGIKAYRDGIADALKMDDHGLKKMAVSTFAIDRDRPRVEITLIAPSSK